MDVLGSHNRVKTDGGRYAAGQSGEGEGGQAQCGRGQSSHGQADQQHGAPCQVGQRHIIHGPSFKGRSVQGQGGQGQGAQGQGGQGRHGAIGGVNCRRGRYSMSKISGTRGEEILPSPKLPTICHI